ncbi:MAG: biotin--[acetyl-CoA-carboxylase] ligase [Treponemataceae bacterium]|nr:MAG: biotin--[acetyl-CoA-carboxylase] ligase [Treponemataceae bacterium]
MQDKYNINRIIMQIESQLETQIAAKIENLSKKIFVFDEVDSTNTVARDFAEKTIADFGESGNADPFAVFIAERQKAGRGRLGRSFFSPSGNGIYMSVLFFVPDFAALTAPGIYTCAAAVAVCEAIEACCGKICGIKWVNDVYLHEKKICGILTEGVTDASGTIRAVVCGIGINVYESDFPDDIAQKAGALLQNAEKCDNERNDLCAALIAHLIRLFENIAVSANTAHIMHQYRKKSFLIGKKVFICSIADYAAAAHPLQALVTGIGEDGSLETLNEHGEKMIFQSGEVSLRL